jgi:subtilase family serine protease
VIYNVNPVVGDNQAGQLASIAVVARSNLYNGTGAGQDVSNFWKNFLPVFGQGNFQIILNGPDPGDLGGGEEAEATLDATWSGAIGYSAAREPRSLRFNQHR